jgi:cell division protein FtsB
MSFAERIVSLLETREEQTELIGKQSAAIEKHTAENATLQTAMQALQHREEIVAARARQAGPFRRGGVIEGAASARQE